MLGTFKYLHKSGFGAGYSNDGAPFDKINFASSNSDGFRSAALEFYYKDLTLGTRIFTGERKMELDYKADKLDDHRDGYVSFNVNPEAYEYMSSPFFVGYKSLRMGIDDWRVGHFVQNILAHTWLKPQVHFQWHNYGKICKCMAFM